MSSLRPGLVLDDKVQLIRQLGEGAMGTVWTAKHLALDVDVAVKLIRRFADDDEVRARFDMEAKAAARIRSPHVVQMLDHGIADGDMPYMVMELLEGESLAERLERTGWLSVQQSVRVLTQVAKALDAAHAVGVVHRDVKPENIFLCPGDDGPFVKLLDFGVAKTTSLGQDPKLTNAGVMIGTPEYMSRQQIISSKHVDETADLWALTIVAYEMLTGDVPFTGETVGQVCVAICSGEFLAPTDVRKGLAPEIDGWFESILAKHATCPYRAAAELAKAFRAAVLPDRYSIEDDLSDDDFFRVREGTEVGLGSPVEDSDELVETEDDDDSAVLVPFTGSDDVVDEASVGGPDDVADEPSVEDDEPSIEDFVLPPESRGSRWLVAAGLLPLIVGALLFATQRPAALQLGGLGVEGPAVAATEVPVDEAAVATADASASTEDDDDAGDETTAPSTAVARRPVVSRRSPPTPAAPPKPETESEPTPPITPPITPPATPKPAATEPTGDERTDYGF